MDDVTTLVNLTPHALTLWRHGSIVRTWPAPPPGTVVPRVEEPRLGQHVLTVDGTDVPVVELAPSFRLHPVPPEVPGTAYVVSRLAAMAVPGRRDIYFPIEHRDDDGVIVGCSGFGQFNAPVEKDPQ